MTSFRLQLHKRLQQPYDFSQFNTIDIGGAQGSSLISARYGIVPPLSKAFCSICLEIIAMVSVDEKIQPLTGNFFDLCHPGSDAYLLRWVVTIGMIESFIHSEKLSRKPCRIMASCSWSKVLFTG